MKIIDFSFFAPTDPRDTFYENWSREYEYPWALARLRAYGVNTVHNTACGGAMQTHVKFEQALSNAFTAIHSDIDKSLDGRLYFDITTPYGSGEKFDAVVCISAIEHIKEVEPITIIKNLLTHVKDGGLVLITFDYPTVDLEKLQRDLGARCRVPDVLLTWDREKLNVVRLEILK